MRVYYWCRNKVMTLAHRYDWHYAPMIGPIAPDGSTQRWCQWCGFRESYPPRDPAMKAVWSRIESAKSEAQP